MSDTVQVKTVEQNWLNVTNAAKYSDLGEKSIRRLLASGKLTAFRPVKGRILLCRDELDSLIRSSTSTPRTGRGLSRGD